MYGNDTKESHYDKKTFLLFEGAGFEALGSWAVIKPTGKNTFETQCILKRTE